MAKDDELVGVGAGSDNATTLGGIFAGDIGLLDAIDLPIIVIGRDCRIARINRAATAVLGLAASDVGSSLDRILAGAANLDRICTRVIADGASHRIETRDGDRCFLIRIAPYTGTDRRMLGAVLTFTNVTAFRASIDQAIYEREYTKAILNTAIDPMVVLDPQLRVQTANRAFYAMFGVTRDETQGISIRKLGNSDWEMSDVWKCLEKTSSDPAELPAVEIEGEFPGIGNRTVLLDARRVTRDTDALTLLTFHDVTERKQAGRTASLMEAIVDSSDDAIVSKTLDGTITSWNKSAERLFGYTAAEAIGQHITLIVPWDRRSEEADILRRLARGERVDHFETIRQRKDGTPVDVSVTISPVKDATGRIIGASKVARDIGERRQAEAALRQSEERLRNLSESLEIQVCTRTAELEERNREILAQAERVRQLSWQLLRAQDEERRHIARELHDSAGQTLTVLGMSLAQLVQKAGRTSPGLASEAESTQELVQQLHREIRTTSYLLHPPLLDEDGLSSALSWYVDGLRERSDMEISLCVSDDLGRLPRDMELVAFRVVQECLTNIFRHSASKTAFIRLARDSDMILVEVQDSGKGMPPQKLAELQLGGSGVGIRGMHERARHIGGDLKIHSDGSGTKISLTIPIPKTAMPQEPDTNKPPHAAIRPGQKVRKG